MRAGARATWVPQTQRCRSGHQDIQGALHLHHGRAANIIPNQAVVLATTTGRAHRQHPQALPRQAKDLSTRVRVWEL